MCRFSATHVFVCYFLSVIHYGGWHLIWLLLLNIVVYEFCWKNIDFYEVVKLDIVFYIIYIWQSEYKPLPTQNIFDNNLFDLVCKNSYSVYHSITRCLVYSYWKDFRFFFAHNLHFKSWGNTHPTTLVEFHMHVSPAPTTKSNTLWTKICLTLYAKTQTSFHT